MKNKTLESYQKIFIRFFKAAEKGFPYRKNKSKVTAPVSGGGFGYSSPTWTVVELLKARKFLFLKFSKNCLISDRYVIPAGDKRRPPSVVRGRGKNGYKTFQLFNQKFTKYLWFLWFYSFLYFLVNVSSENSREKVENFF